MTVGQKVKLINNNGICVSIGTIGEIVKDVSSEFKNHVAYKVRFGDVLHQICWKEQLEVTN